MSYKCTLNQYKKENRLGNRLLDAPVRTRVKKARNECMSNQIKVRLGFRLRGLRVYMLLVRQPIECRVKLY